MSSVLINVLIAVGITSVAGFALLPRLQNRDQPRSHAGVGGGSSSEGGSYPVASDGFSFGGWFSSDNSSISSDAGSCSSSDSGSGGDCGGGGDSGGGSSGD